MWSVSLNDSFGGKTNRDMTYKEVHESAFSQLGKLSLDCSDLKPRFSHAWFLGTWGVASCFLTSVTYDGNQGSKSFLIMVMPATADGLGI